MCILNCSSKVILVHMKPVLPHHLTNVSYNTYIMLWLLIKVLFGKL